ncbi:phosphosulfolactate synthase [Fictibacillus gelatini]|uniref:phosphosulfolactate synthase n=1 Tax=Fictibacillus gelatini TaxID=225985 RepID=UPI000685169C|nr:phosphosulfolactate synthase [Fictibacillus gelatini]
MTHPPCNCHPRLIDPTGERTGKLNDVGLTMLIDKGIGLVAFEELLQLAGSYVDFIKLGFGTMALYPPELLQKKLLLAKKHDVILYPGGTLFELAYQQDVLMEHLHHLKDIGFEYIEISDGTIDLPFSERCKIIREAAKLGFNVITECGKKADGSCLDIEDLKTTLYSDLECGACFVIVEGRESGENIGIYDKKGDIGIEFLSAVEKNIPSKIRKHLIWEAPQKNQQIGLIRFWGRNVNIGNIQMDDAINLECLRRGLRYDTFPNKRSGTITTTL